MSGLRWSEDQYKTFKNRCGLTIPDRRVRKYRNEPTGGHASRREHQRALELRMLEQGHQIYDLREQVRFELIPKQDGERAVTYIADFVYVNRAGNTVVEDTKGVRTPEYIIKRKLMLWRHGVKIIEV